MAHTAEGHGLIFEGVAEGFGYHMLNLVIGVGLLLAIWALEPRYRGSASMHGRSPFSPCSALLPDHLAGRDLLRPHNFPLYIGLAMASLARWLCP